MSRSIPALTVAVAILLAAASGTAATLQTYAHVNIVPGAEARLDAAPPPGTVAHAGLPGRDEATAPCDITLTGPADCEVSVQIQGLPEDAAWSDQGTSIQTRIDASHDDAGLLQLSLPLAELADAATDRVVITVIYE